MFFPLKHQYCIGPQKFKAFWMYKNQVFSNKKFYRMYIASVLTSDHIMIERQMLLLLKKQVCTDVLSV